MIGKDRKLDIETGLKPGVQKTVRGLNCDRRGGSAPVLASHRKTLFLALELY